MVTIRLYVFAAIAVVIIGLLIWYLAKRNRRKRGDQPFTGNVDQPSSFTPDEKPHPFAENDLDNEARASLARGNKIEAIKLVRERTGLGLKEAKDYVERL